MLSLIPHRAERRQGLSRGLAGRISAGPVVLFLILIGLVTTGCAASSSMHRGHDAEVQQDYDRAVAEYTKVLRLKPGDVDARTSLDRARLRAAEDHFQKGRRLSAISKLEEALIEYQLASEMNPTSGDIEDALRSTRNQLRAKVTVAREGKTELQTLVERARDLPPTGLELPQVRMPD